MVVYVTEEERGERERRERERDGRETRTENSVFCEQGPSVHASHVKSLYWLKSPQVFSATSESKDTMQICCVRQLHASSMHMGIYVCMIGPSRISSCQCISPGVSEFCPSHGSSVLYHDVAGRVVQ